MAEWINWPLTWLSYWLVFGVVVLLAAKLFRASTTLQRFYAATGYAAKLLMLVGLGSRSRGSAGSLHWRVPCWPCSSTGKAVRTVTGLSGGESALCVAAPLALSFIFAMVVAGATVASVVRMMLL
ncbi:MAG: hypothetical protein R3A10_04110 [Caldilineaceae bacterium]